MKMKVLNKSGRCHINICPKYLSGGVVNGSNWFQSYMQMKQSRPAGLTPLWMKGNHECDGKTLTDTLTFFIKAFLIVLLN